MQPMKNLTDLMNTLPPERRARVEERAADLIEEEMCRQGIYAKRGT